MKAVVEVEKGGQTFLSGLAARRRFGMKPGLETIAALCRALGDPQERFRAIHVAGTNGKGAVCAILDAALRASAAPGEAAVVGRYTSPHLVRLNERFCLGGSPVADATLERLAARVSETAARLPAAGELTFFEALTAVAFLLFAETRGSRAVLECGLGGRLDATNVCRPELCVITRIGLDHCDWLGRTVEEIAAEKAGIVKPGVPVVLAANEPSVVDVVRKAARAQGAPFHYAPDLASDAEIPADFSLQGAFNRENAVTALAALKVLSRFSPLTSHPSSFASGSRTTDGGQPTAGRQRTEDSRQPGLTSHFSLLTSRFFSNVVWPGRFQRVGSFLVDGAHNPPAARALASALAQLPDASRPLDLVFGACGDKDVDAVLRALAPSVRRAFAVRTGNPRARAAEDLAARMRAVGLAATPCASLREAFAHCAPRTAPGVSTLVCGSLFLAGEALVELGAYPWEASRFDPSERLRAESLPHRIRNRRRP